MYKIFKVGYEAPGVSCYCDYVVCNGSEDIIDIIAKRNSTTVNNISITSCEEASVEEARLSDLTVGDFLKLVKHW